ncbi:MAG TPA: hypothetical protein VLA71_01505 [Algoriphagus sp.]|nr:hypothetical protein [Algoriphagus sp.]
MSDAYGFLAPIYQPLSRVVFGGDLVEANQTFNDLARDKKCLIIGGGDAVAYRDWNADFAGEYWDSSLKMAELAKVNLSKTKVNVNCGKWPGQGEFDVVLLPFVLDTIPEKKIEKFILLVSSCLTLEGKVIISDFFPPQTILQYLIQQLMIIGFRIFAGHPRRDLPDIRKVMDQVGLKFSKEKIWRKGWIRAQVYEKSINSSY